MEKTDFSKIELLVLDVDGVLTDGSVTLDEDGREIKTFHCRDGAGMKYWQRVGKKIALITGRGSPVVTARAAELGVQEVHMHVKDGYLDYDGKVFFQLPGEGSLDLSEYFRLLLEREVAIPVIAEISAMIWKRSDYDPWDTADRCFAALNVARTNALKELA